jgi:F-type H+-transporting ATPase subunit b
VINFAENQSYYKDYRLKGVYMIELNIWFFVQLANFLVLLFLLNHLLFKPLLNLFVERKERVESAVDEAKRLNIKKDEELRRFNRELSEAREKAQETYRALREEGLARQKELIEKAQSEAMAEIESATEAIRRESERVRRQIKEDLSIFSDEIVKKLVEA